MLHWLASDDIMQVRVNHWCYFTLYSMHTCSAVPPHNFLLGYRPRPLNVVVPEMKMPLYVQNTLSSCNITLPPEIRTPLYTVFTGPKCVHIWFHNLLCWLIQAQQGSLTMSPKQYTLGELPGLLKLSHLLTLYQIEDMQHNPPPKQQQQLHYACLFFLYMMLALSFDLAASKTC